MMNSTKKNLIKVKNLITRGWCRKSWARMKNGTPCGGRDKKAVRFCLLGAIDKVTGSYNNVPETTAIQSKLPIGFYTVDGYNDAQKDKRTIIRFLNRIIKSL